MYREIILLGQMHRPWTDAIIICYFFYMMNYVYTGYNKKDDEMKGHLHTYIRDSGP
jgi:uncharacterized protein (DUF2225 family)